MRENTRVYEVTNFFFHWDLGPTEPTLTNTRPYLVPIRYAFLVPIARSQNALFSQALSQLRGWTVSITVIENILYDSHRPCSFRQRVSFGFQTIFHVLKKKSHKINKQEIYCIMVLLFISFVKRWGKKSYQIKPRLVLDIIR